ncbi:hypothetical protein [Methanoregula sp.]|jgi:hypothetical protein|uniref:hypothetical protein n=1 Tax=Methanoregula sp. TaxID=2052170 RepID=UPI003563A469
MGAIDIMRNSSMDKILRSIKPDNVEGYISTKKNYFKDFGNDVISIYRNKDDKNLQIKIPLRREFSDYSLLLNDTIGSIAIIEKRNALEIVTNLKMDHPSDIIRFRLHGEETKDGTAPLKSGAALYSGALDILLASAFVIEKPERKKYTHLKGVASLIEQCRIGQTEFGSYSVPLICPLFKKDNKSINFLKWDDKPENTFTRKVTTQLMKSLNHIVDAISNDKTEKLMYPLKEDIIINSKLYVALTEMRPKYEKLSLDIKSDWLIEPPKENVRQIVSINNDCFKEIERVAEVFTPESESGLQVYYAQVVQLKDHMISEKEYEFNKGQIGVTALVPGGEIVRAKLTLDEDDYKKALKAHSSRKTVKIKGVLKRGKRDHHIIEIENFEITE